MAKNKTSKKRKGSIFTSVSKAPASSQGLQTGQPVENTSKTEANMAEGRKVSPTPQPGKKFKFSKTTKHKAK